MRSAWILIIASMRLAAQGSIEKSKPSFAWSPDGAYVSECSVAGLYRINAESGARTLVVGRDKMGSFFQALPCRAEWHPNSGQILLAGPREIAVVDPSGKMLRRWSEKTAVSAARFSPDGKWISYVAGDDLVVVGAGEAVRRTVVAHSDPERLRAQPDWLYRNKLAMDVAYWWAPDSSAIAYLEIDRLPGGKLFATAEDPFAAVSLRIAEWKRPGAAISVRLPAGEAYLPQIAWTPDSRNIAVQRLDRAQKRLDLLLVERTTGVVRPILSEADSYWVNADPSGLRFVPGGRRFLWTSERTGFRHIYLYDCSGELVGAVTRGEWEVSSVDAVVGADVVYTSTQESSVERHLYRAPMSGAGEAVKLTSQAGWHEPIVAANGRILDLWSSARQSPSVAILGSSGKEIPVQVSGEQLLPATFATMKTHDGWELNTMLIRPPDFDSARKYPALILAPTGPRSQVVRNASDSPEYKWAQQMARKGFVVFAADGRGSGGRGHRWEEPVHFRLGGMELPDQLDALAVLRREGYVDMKRLGIYGSGYAGMLALGAMMHSHGVYQAGVVHDPITVWTAVDAYTAERYLGAKDAVGVPYDESSPVDFSKRLEGRLLITTSSDSEHTEALEKELEKRGKLTPERALIEKANRAAALERATRFFVEALKENLSGL